MTEFKEETGPVVDLNLGSSGKILASKQDKIALIDADTVIFAACVVCEYLEETDVGIGEVKWEEVYKIDLDEAYDAAMAKIQEILDLTGCSDFELHFTSGRESFRYTRVDEEYKANRNGLRVPVGIKDLKEYFVDKFPTKAFNWTEFEADDVVVSKKLKFPELYELCAVDKDVRFAIVGKHFNYFKREDIGREMRYEEVEADTVLKHFYMQTLTGDKGDNVIGLSGIGPKKAEKILDGKNTHKELWEAVVEAYEAKGRCVTDAIKNMRLVNMYQVKFIGDNPNENKFEVVLWKPEK